MNSKSLPATPRAALPGHGVAAPASASVRLILKMLGALTDGALLLKAPDGSVQLYGDGSHPITLELKDWTMCAAVLRSGDIGFAETFIGGHWKTDNLPGLIELLIRNRSVIEALIYGTWWGSLLYRAKHFLNRNSRSGSKKNIHAHYDIGNRFYHLWLDPSMSYSSALFSTPGDADLERAQWAKYRRILDQLDLAPGAKVLEIGCGWGAFAEVAIREKKAHVTGLTLSTEQLDYARQRLETAGLAGGADL